MSPEQARGEGHRVDGRSRHLQPGRRLLRAADRPQAVPRRHARRGHGADRHGRAAAAPPDRRHDPPRAGADLPEGAGQAGVGAVQHGPRPGRRPAALPPDRGDVRAAPPARPRAIAAPPGSTQEATPLPPTPARSDSDGPAVKVVPKGLRSFDQHDADFFLELLPGPRDRDGLPESLRFWKTRIEATDPDTTFRVGLIYGPSGCGKSSLVKAGLLPRLAQGRAAGLRRGDAGRDRGPAAAGPAQGLPRPAGRRWTWSRRWRRCGGAACSAPGQKVLLVLDQFEQWLFARRDEQDTELVAALRQCDGEHVQAIVHGPRRLLDGGDPVHAATWRSDLVEGENSPPVDLFDPRHARKVLAAFGRAYGALPERSGRAHAGPGGVPRPGGRGAGPGRQGHLGAAGAVRRDGQGEAVDPGDPARGRRHARASA